jgi:hypothetical protein
MRLMFFFVYIHMYLLSLLILATCSLGPAFGLRCCLEPGLATYLQNTSDKDKKIQFLFKKILYFWNKQPDPAQGNTKKHKVNRL